MGSTRFARHSCGHTVRERCILRRVFSGEKKLWIWPMKLFLRRGCSLFFSFMCNLCIGLSESGKKERRIQNLFVALWQSLYCQGSCTVQRSNCDPCTGEKLGFFRY